VNSVAAVTGYLATDKWYQRYCIAERLL